MDITTAVFYWRFKLNTTQITFTLPPKSALPSEFLKWMNFSSQEPVYHHCPLLSPNQHFQYWVCPFIFLDFFFNANFCLHARHHGVWSICLQQPPNSSSFLLPGLLCSVLSPMPLSESSLVKYKSDPVHPLIKLALACVSLHKSSLTFLCGLINYALLQSMLLKQCLIY